MIQSLFKHRPINYQLSRHLPFCEVIKKSTAIPATLLFPAKPFRWLAKMQQMEIFVARSVIGVMPVDAKAVRRTFGRKVFPGGFLNVPLLFERWQISFCCCIFCKRTKDEKSVWIRYCTWKSVRKHSFPSFHLLHPGRNHEKSLRIPNMTWHPDSPQIMC